MPEVSIFFGIIIRIHYRDHNPPHFHAEYQGFEAIFNIKTGEKMKGLFPPKANKIVTEWAGQHKEELLESWSQVKNNISPNKIPGADR